MHIGFIICLLTAGLLAPLRADTLEGALNRLDRAGSQFKGMTADFEYVKYTAIVKLPSDSIGKIKIKKVKNTHPPDDIRGLLDFLSPDKKTVAINGKTVNIFLPNIKTVQVIDLGEHKVLLEQFFLFGFGTSRSDLEAAYVVSYGGPENIGGEATTRLVLVSKKKEVVRQLPKFELWLSDKTGEPVQQKFYEPIPEGQQEGDYNVFTYSHMEINPKLDDKALELHLPSNVKTERIKR